MITLANTLKVGDILPDLTSDSMANATKDLLNLLRHDKRITNWAKLVDATSAIDICVEGALNTNFCIPHARTNAVQNMVIAVGRSPGGIGTGADKPDRCHYFFYFGIPATMDADYLRLIGAVARIFHHEASVEALNAANSATELHQALAAAEKRF